MLAADEPGGLVFNALLYILASGPSDTSSLSKTSSIAFRGWKEKREFVPKPPL